MLTRTARRAGARGVCLTEEGERAAGGFSVLAGRRLCCVLEKLSCRKRNEVDTNLFLPLRTLFMVAEHLPATAVLHPGGGSAVAVGDVIPACISSGPTRQTVSNALSE